MTFRLLLTTAIISATALFAQDPPSRVARLNWIAGPVSFQPAILDTWAAATVNYPLTTGDHLYTDQGARAEMHIGPNAIRLNALSNFGFLNLDDRTVQMRFTSGAMEVRLRALGDQDIYEVDTPNGAISLLRGGEYRIDTDPDRNATMVTVFAGEVEVTANGNSFAVRPRQTAFFADGAAADVRDANPPDEFDGFTADRNNREERTPPPPHVPQGMIGAEDLGSQGSWRDVPGYGWVWAPPVQPGWAPYRQGHWAWVEPWGWTWIDDAPWGFAPFHYGRWAFVGGAGWVWIPGTGIGRPVYAPALVAFVGGPRFAVGIGIGGGIGAVAWFPLGPQEVYRPAYAVSNVYIRNVNVTNVTVTNINVTNVRYVNQSVAGAVTAVPQNAFAGARPIAGAALRVTPEQTAQAQVLGAAPPVTPLRESVLGSSNASANVARPPQALAARQVVAKSTPPPAAVSFQARQTALAQNPGRPLAPEQIAQIRQQQPAAVVNSAPVRAAGATQPLPNRSPSPGTGGGVPSPANRLDSRPPNARSVGPQGGASQSAVPAAQERAVQQSRPAPQAGPQTAGRPVQEGRPASAQAARPAPAQKKATKKQEDRKDDRR